MRHAFLKPKGSIIPHFHKQSYKQAASLLTEWEVNVCERLLKSNNDLEDWLTHRVATDTDSHQHSLLSFFKRLHTIRVR